MTISDALGSMPNVIEQTLGERVLEKCLSAASLPSDISAHQGSFIPEIALDACLETAAREAGDAFWGLVLAPHLSVMEYGDWGDYVLQAPDLVSSLKRAINTLYLHASEDRLALLRGPRSTKFQYMFGERSGRGYHQIALSALGPMLSIPKHFLGSNWMPLAFDIDFGNLATAKHIEKELQCKTRSEMQCLAIEIPNDVLLTKNPVDPRTWTTLRDVEKACKGGPPEGIVSIVEMLVSQKLGVDGLTLDDVAKTLAMSRRTLQRRLDQQGTDFRRVMGFVKMRRARDLLVETPASVSEIGAFLNYSTSSHFARAFKREYGVSPVVYRAEQCRAYS